MLHLFWGDLAFLNRMAITVGAIAVVLAIATLASPLKEPVSLPTQSKIELKASNGAKLFGAVVVVATAILYVIFW